MPRNIIEEFDDQVQRTTELLAEYRQTIEILRTHINNMECCGNCMHFNFFANSDPICMHHKRIQDPVRKCVFYAFDMKFVEARAI